MKTTYNTAMRNAFENVRVDYNIRLERSPLANTVMNALSTKAGIKNVGRGWTANVSQRTLQALTKQGVFA